MGGETSFSISVDINTPVDRVFEVMIDTDRWAEWTPSVKSIKRLDTGAFRVGSRAVIRQPKLPPALWTITEITPGHSFTWENRAPGIRVIAHHFADPTATGSRATLTLRYQGVLARLLSAITRGITNRYLWMEASGLKARSENPNYKRSDERSD